MVKLLKKRKQVTIHVLAWLAFIITMATFVLFENGFLPKRFYIAIGSAFVVFYTNYTLLVPYLLIKKRVFFYFLCVIILIIAPVLIVTQFYSLTEFEEFTKLHDYKGFVIDNEVVKRAFYIVPVLFNAVFLVIGSTARVYEQLIKNERNKQLIESEKTNTELQFLKNQINPHFLFNSLNSIYSLTIQKSNDAPEAVITLSELMRYMLYQTNSDFVLLKSEIDFIKNYIKLQRLRIVDNKDVNINVHGIISNQKIRPLLLISFIENAFKYGTDFKGNTEVSIKIYVKEDEVQFTCTNLIGNRNKDIDNSGIGLQNTKNRLELLYPEKHWLIVKEEENKFIVDLTLKLS